MKVPLPVNTLALSLVLVKSLDYFYPFKYIIPESYRTIGLVFLLLGLMLIAWAVIYFRKQKTDIMPAGKPTSLIVGGPFRISRNPIYVGMALIILGFSTFLGSLTSFLPILFFIFVIEKKNIPFEEKRMENTFGQEYLEYKKKVRRWI